jgi:tetratricopeptide (TPR) repeat protein
MRIKTRIGLAMLMMAGGMLAQPVPVPAAHPAPHPAPKMTWAGADLYRSAVRLIDERQYEKAVLLFDQVVREKGARTEGALYWKAYALRRLGKNSEALAVLGELESGFPASRWKNDAKALEVEIRQPAPASQDDEDLKLLALNGLVQNEPESAVPLLEKILASGKSSPRMKQRALYVLAQSRNGRAREVVTQYARGGANPDLQLTAIDYLGAVATPEATRALSEIYQGSNDAAVKRMALQGMARARDRAMLLQIVKAEADLEFKKEAIRQLGRTDAAEMLKELYRTETDRGVRVTVVAALGDYGKPGVLVELARAEKDAGMKKEIVRRLSGMRSKEAQAYLVELLQE